VTLFPVLFSVYWCSVLVWCLLASRLCDALSSRHPLLYAALGRPALTGSDLRGDLALMRFLFGGRDRFLRDRPVAVLCGTLRVLLCVYVLFFLSLPGLVFADTF
jgi:hypothetical protein